MDLYQGDEACVLFVQHTSLRIGEDKAMLRRSRDIVHRLAVTLCVSLLPVSCYLIILDYAYVFVCNDTTCAMHSSLFVVRM